MKNKRGFSVVEVMVSVILLAFLAIFIVTFFVSSVNMISQTKEVTNVLFSAQNNIEEINQELNVLSLQRAELQDELAANPGNPTLQPKIDAVERKMKDAAGPIKKYTLFGMEVGVFELEANILDATTGAPLVQLNTLTADMPRVTPVVAKIKSLDIKDDVGNTRVAYFYDAGDKVTSLFEYISPATGKYKEIYQWFSAPKKYHSDSVPITMWDYQYDPTQAAPYYPGVFDLIGSEQGTVLPNIEKYIGRLVLCRITPVTKTGYYGTTVDSNFLYISPLPKLSKGKYAMMIDPSFLSGITSRDSAAKFVTTRRVDSQKAHAVSSYLESIGTTPVSIALFGENTSNSPKEEDTAYSRYLSFYNSSMQPVQMKSRGIAKVTAPSTNISIYAVVRSANGKIGNIVTSEDGGTPYLDFKPAGADSVNTFAYPPISEGSNQWTVVANEDLGKLGNIYMIGGAPGSEMNLDIAELLVVHNATPDERKKIIAYLQERHQIK